ncbi:MAG: VWA domain-containing protein, partial [Planctomycetes bacterium]|nr:VWA domain-containing protein [Planctomycetota bacterium]
MGPLQSFVNPGLLGLAALALVPLLIHLLRRRKPRTLEWGAMRLVRLAHERTRRRTSLENLLLLLLRMAAVAAAALLVARPLLDRSALPGVIDTPRRDVVLLIDASASMQQRVGGESAFERALREAAGAIADLREERGDRVLLILAETRARVLAERSLAEARAALAGELVAGDGTADYAGACALIGQWLARRSELEARQAPELRLYTDLQRDGFAAREFTAALDALAAHGVTFDVHALVPPGPAENLALAAPRVLLPHPRPGQPLPIEVEVHNAGTRPATARLALYVGGEKVGSEALGVDGGARASARFEARVAQSGEVLVEARLEHDLYALDDAHGSVIDVAAPLEVLLVSGETSSDPERDPTTYLQAALSTGSSGAAENPLTEAALFDARVIGAAELESPELDLLGPGMVWLADLPGLPAAAAQRLRARLDAGRPLVISLGPRSAARAWEPWSAGAQGEFGPQALLPAQLFEAREFPARAGGYFRAADIDAAHPALAFFGDERWRPLLCELPFRGFVAATPARGARVLARFDDAGASPLLLELPLARASTYLWTSSFDRAWSRLPDSPRTLIPLLQEWLIGA